MLAVTPYPMTETDLHCIHEGLSRDWEWSLRDVCACVFVMQSSRLRSLFRFGGPGKVHSIPPYALKRPFFERPPPWWAKLTWGFIAADIFVTCALHSHLLSRHLSYASGTLLSFPYVLRSMTFKGRR